ncbi:MAG: cupin domain-containing protein [Actinobacteria bacterium]|nr:cupin domain-containing protein [Actinomycetota bacterium]
MIAHWDDLEPTHEAEGTIEFDGYDLGQAAGTRDVGVTRARVRPGKQSSPVHVEVAEEEIFFVLGGTGLSWQDGETFEIRAGDCIVHRVGEEAHTLIGGSDGLDVLAFGERSTPTITWLPRPRVVRAGVSLEVPPIDPWALEAAQGELELRAPSSRRANIVNVDSVEGKHGWLPLGSAAGSIRTGLKHVTVPAGQLHAPPHCHSAEEEIFVVLEGDGALELTPSPKALDDGAQPETHPVRAGHVISRLPGTRIAHALRAGPTGLTVLAYGTRDPNDITYYPRSNKIFFRGVGLIARVDHLVYEAGEESTV